jgi:MoxR-like ATPase
MTQDNTNPIPQCWQDVQDVLAAGIDRLILFGPPGTGKTYAGLTLGNTNAGAYRVACTEDMTEAEVTGCWMPNASGTWSWHLGKAIKAWEGDGITGGRLVLDEIDRANGDIESLLLAVTDTVESAKWEHPETGRTARPRDGFSVVMTTNLEQMTDLPTALKDRFPVAIRINQPHPDALAALPADLRAPAAAAADANPGRRFSIRTFQQFAVLRQTMELERAAALLFGPVASDIIDAIRIDKVSA